ncbi:MAG: MFS transporter [Pseudonocardiales bacterium]|nr:MFS transporter [Pseudonocardiales bacterium]
MSSLRLLRANGAFRLLWTARAVSFLGDSLSLVALMLHVAASTGHALAVALLLLVGDGVPALFGPLAGTISDRFELKRVLVGCEVAQGVIVMVIALWLPSLPLLLALVAVRGIAGQIFQPASRAVVPDVVRDRDLEGANAAIGIGTNGGEALGPLLAAILFPIVGVRGVLLVDAATFVVSALLLAVLPLRLRTPETDTERTSLWQDTGAGLRYIVASPLVRTIGLGFFAVVAFTGIDDVALVFLATDTLGAGSSAVAVLLAAVGIGLFIGYALLARPHRIGMVALLLAGFATNAAGNLLTGLAWAVTAAFLFQAVRGLGIAALDIAVNTLLQRNVPTAYLGRVFGSLYAAVGIAAALSYVLGGLLIDATNPRVAFLVAGSGGLLTTAVVAIALRRSAPPTST